MIFINNKYAFPKSANAFVSNTIEAQEALDDARQYRQDANCANTQAEADEYIKEAERLEHHARELNRWNLRGYRPSKF